MDTFAKRLKYHRQAAGLSQSELAALVRSSQSAVGNWESGARQMPRAKTLRAISLALDAPLHVLLGESELTMAPAKAELRLLVLFRSLDAERQRLAIRLVRALRTE